MTKVKCIKGYFDTKLNRHVDVDEELEVTDDRAKQLIKAKVAAAITATAEAAKKPTRKKKEA